MHPRLIRIQGIPVHPGVEPEDREERACTEEVDVEEEDCHPDVVIIPGSVRNSL